MILKEMYLGDGVYASFDGDNISLDLRAQDPTPNNAIVLEPAIMVQLDNFRKEITGGEPWPG